MHVSLLLTQIISVLVLSRVLGLLLRAIKQPPVVGEMITGVLLGPVVFGSIAPELQRQLFSTEQLAELKGISELGLVLMMFVTGADFRIRGSVQIALAKAGLITAISLIVPLIFGVLIGSRLYTRFAGPSASTWSFATFLGVALSITALPVMIRIVHDRSMERSIAGNISVAAAVLTDVASWILLFALNAFIISATDWREFGTRVAALLLLCTIMFGIVRSFLNRASANPRTFSEANGIPQAGLIIGLLCCTQLSQLVGAHAAFGAFLFGLCVPRNDVSIAGIVRGAERITGLIFTPIFFAYSGLIAASGRLSSTQSLTALAVILLVASIGKLGGSVVGARIAGYDWRTSLSIGALMNARGLMELIVARIGVDLGIIDESMFTILLVVAVITTLLSGPLLDAFHLGQRQTMIRNDELLDES